jgi:hypothetical protein
MSDDTEKQQGEKTCKNCATCGKGMCETFQRVVDTKGREFAERWHEAKEKLPQGKADEAPPADAPNPAQD